MDEVFGNIHSCNSNDLEYFFSPRTFLTAASGGVKRTGRSGLTSSSGHRPRSRPAAA